MNKKEFLDSLEKKLSVLEESEREDILSEYTDTINEKIKQGQSEEDAVKDFGDIDDLVKEILKAYKINPDFEDKEESFTQKSEELIKQGASKVADFSRNLADKFKKNNNEINLEFIFEIIIKIFVVLIAALVLKGIFELFSNLGESLFDNTFEPAASLLSGVWSLLLLIIYILLCILIVIAMFKKYFSSDDNIETVKESIEDKSTTNTSKQLDKEENKKVKKNKGSSLGDICLLIIKVLVILYVIIPLIIFDALSVFGLVVSIIYFIKGINLLGMIIFLAGLTLIITYLIKIFINLLFSKGKASIIPFIISIILMVVGGILFADMVMNIDYIDKAPNNVKTEIKEQTFTTNNDVLINHYPFGHIEKTADDTMDDNTYKIKVTYNEKYQELEFTEEDVIDCENYYEENYDSEDECQEKTYHSINITVNNIDEFNETKNTYHEFIENLKDNKVYNYNDAYNVDIEIIANPKTLEKIKNI